MPTADRTTIRAAVDELVSKLRANLAANPPTASKPFRRVEVGEARLEEYTRPFLVLRVLRARPIAVTDDDRVFEVATELRIVTDVTASDPHAAVLDKIGAVEDYLDAIRDTGVIAGTEGLDDRAWAFTYPRQTSGSRTIAAEAQQTMIVKVQRTYNRVPAA